MTLAGKDEYAAWSCDAWGELRKSKGFRGWMAQAIHTREDLSTQVVRGWLR